MLWLLNICRYWLIKGRIQKQWYLLYAESLSAFRWAKLTQNVSKNNNRNNPVLYVGVQWHPMGHSYIMWSSCYSKQHIRNLYPWFTDIWNSSSFVHFNIISDRLYETPVTADATPVLRWKMKRVSHETHVIILFSNSSLFFGGFLLFARCFGFDWAEQTARSVICIKWIPLLSRMKGVFFFLSQVVSRIKGSSLLLWIKQLSQSRWEMHFLLICNLWNCLCVYGILSFFRLQKEEFLSIFVCVRFRYLWCRFRAMSHIVYTRFVILTNQVNDHWDFTKLFCQLCLHDE